MNRWKSLSLLSLAVLMLAACSSGVDDIFGGSSQTYEIRGTVDYVDTNSRTIQLTNVSGYTNMLSSGNTVRVYYDDRTPVEYQGRAYRPENLERGDQVAVRVDESGNALVAESVTVLYDASGGTTSGYGSTLRGTVRWVDTSNRTLQIESVSWISRYSGGTTGSVMTLRWDANTGVDVQGRLHPVENLERGDVIEVQVRDSGSSTPFAERIVLVRDVRR